MPAQSFARRWLAPALIYSMVPLALLAVVWLRDRGLVADTPIWAFVAALVASGAANSSTAVLLARRPESRSRMHLRIAAAAFGTSIVIYAAGWGAMLVVAYAVGSAELLRSVGGGMLKPMLGWNYATIVVGELAVALGWAPSVIDPALGHAVAAAGAICLTIVTIVLVSTAESAEAAESHLAQRRRYFEALVENTRDVIADLSPDGRVRHASPSLSRLLGYSVSDAVGEWIGTYLHPDDAAHLDEAFAQVLHRKGVPFPFDVRIMHSDGIYREVVATLTGAELDGEVTVIANLHDVTRQRQLERQLIHDARHDVLTGLLNRRAFHAVADAASERTGGPGRHLGVMYIDLDGFKAINDSFGHETGDRVLVETARRIERCVRPNDVLARLGGDEFAVLVTLEGGPHPPVEVADRILDALARPIAGLPFEVRIGASIGIAVRSEEGIEMSSLIRDADSAMYAAKKEGRARWRLAQP